MKKISIKKNAVLGLLLFLSIVFCIIQIIRAAPPNPGHGWLDIGNDSGDALGANRGGTGLTTLTADNVLLGNGAGPVKFVAYGASGNVLKSNGTTWTSGNAIPTNAVVLLYADEVDTSQTVSTSSEIVLKSWVLADPTLFSFYILEAEVWGNLSYVLAGSNNLGLNFTWNFAVGGNTTTRKTINWRFTQGNTRTRAGKNVRLAGTIKTVINNTLPASANLRINGQMNNSNAGAGMGAHSFRVYGIK